MIGLLASCIENNVDLFGRMKYMDVKNDQSPIYFVLLPFYFFTGQILLPTCLTTLIQQFYVYNCYFKVVSYKYKDSRFMWPLLDLCLLNGPLDF